MKFRGWELYHLKTEGTMGEKTITRNSSAWFVYFVFIDTPAYLLQNFFFGEAEAPFLHQVKSLCNFFLFMEGESSWSTQCLTFYPSQSLHVFK